MHIESSVGKPQKVFRFHSKSQFSSSSANADDLHNYSRLSSDNGGGQQMRWVGRFSSAISLRDNRHKPQRNGNRANHFKSQQLMQDQAD